jgi:predicted acetyltransferase
VQGYKVGIRDLIRIQQHNANKMIGWLFVINDKVIGIVLITHRLDLNKKVLHISVQDLYFIFVYRIQII